jgi:hypothetical protein
MEQDSHTLLGLDWFRQTKCVLDCDTGRLTFPKEEILAYQNENENENEEKSETFFAEIDEEELMDFASWEDEPKVPIQIENKNLNEEEKKEIVKIIDSYDIFANDYNKLGSCTVGMHTITTDNEKPIYVPPYRKSYKEREEIKEEVIKMLEAGIIQHSRSPWSFPVVQVPKKNGTRRFCVDFRKLNSITQQDCFPLPRIDDILDRLSTSRVFTTIDLKSGYWQVKLSKESIPKTAFSTPDGHFEFLRLPFGLKNAPAEFSRIMQQVLGDFVSFVEIYLDDITIHSKNEKEHLQHLIQVFKRINQANLKINGSKCNWFASKIQLLGHIVSENGVAMNPEKVSAIQLMKPPRNVKDVQRFLGMSGYYRKYILDYAKITEPLTNLTRKDVPFDFNESCVEAYDFLKEKFQEAPILRQFDQKQPIILFTDASGFALGAILSQTDKNGKEYVCSFASRLLKGAELHYGITEKECLAVIWAIKHYRIYLYGTNFTVINDHKALHFTG